MKKLLKISALALIASAVLLGCANPSGESKSNSSTSSPIVTPPMNTPSLKDIDAPSGGTNNTNDKFCSNTWESKPTDGIGDHDNNVFGTDGTILIYDLGIDPTGTTLNSKAEYKIDDQYIYIQTTKIAPYDNLNPTESDLLTREEIIEKNVNDAISSNSEDWQICLEKANGNEEMAKASLVYGITYMINYSFALTKCSYKKTSEGSYTIQEICPEFDSNNFENFTINFKAKTSNKDFTEDYTQDPTTAPSGNEIPLINAITGEKVTATWTKTGTENNQEITININEDSCTYIVNENQFPSFTWTKITTTKA